MDYSEFEKGFSMLAGAFGERAFPPARKELLWRRYEGAAPGMFENAIQIVVLHMMTPASIISFLDDRLRSAVHGDERAFQAWAERQPPCPACERTGLVQAQYVPPGCNAPHEITFRCSCSVGRRIRGADRFAIWPGGLYATLDILTPSGLRMEQVNCHVKTYGTAPITPATNRFARYMRRDVAALAAGMGRELPYDPSEREAGHA